MERRLAAILAADVVGYSRLIGENEEATLAAIKAHRKELFEPKVRQYRGRIVKLMGDGALMEFPSAVDAVAFAVEVQCAMAERNRAVPENRQILYRLGINVGDIVLDDDDIFGDGVNIAARLEGLAEPGGICVARHVVNQVKGKLDLSFELLGRRKVKNISQPVTVYRIVLDDKARQLVTAFEAAPTVRDRKRHYAVATALGVLLAAGGVLWWQPWASGTNPEKVKTVPVEKLSPSLPDKPSIAVLPFTNMSADPDQEYFADGITEDLITDISKVSGLFVIARNSTFAYKKLSIDVRDVARELGVRYVLEGSVQRAGDQVRINVQLIDAGTGGHLWAERYDRELRDVFALQDEVVQKIAVALSVKLRSGEKSHLSRSAQAHPEAYDMLLRGLERYWRFTRETLTEAQDYFERAIALDPNFARAHADLALSKIMAVQLGLDNRPEASTKEALRIAEHALSLDDSVREVHFVLGIVYRTLNRHDDALKAALRAIALDPNYADGYAQLAITRNYSGQPKEGLKAVKRAMELNPRHPFFYVWILGQSYYLLGRYEEAAETFELVKASNPHFPAAHKMLAVTYTELGRAEDAEWAVAEYKTLVPDYTLDREATSAPYKDQAVFKRYIDALRKAGM